MCPRWQLNGVSVDMPGNILRNFRLVAEWVMMHSAASLVYFLKKHMILYGGGYAPFGSKTLIHSDGTALQQSQVLFTMLHKHLRQINYRNP